MSDIVSLLGLVGGLALLIVLTLRGWNLFISAPLCALLVALTSGIPVFLGDTNFVQNYMDGFTGFIASWFFMFLLGSIFGKFMEDTGAADSVAAWITHRLGRQRAVLAVVIACAVLTYGGVSLFVVAFAVYPMALGLFKEANLPRRFIPAALAFGSVTFTMTSAGSPEIQNWIPMEFLGTTPYAAWEVSLVVAVFMAVFGYWWLQRIIRRATDRGEAFQARESDLQVTDRELPHPLTGLIPLVVVLGVSFFYHDTLMQNALIVALLSGVLTLMVINWRFFRDMQAALGHATTGALVAIGNTAAVVGFGGVARVTPAFDVAVAAVTSLPGNELVGAAIAVSAIAGLTGSASGGQVIALPAVGPHYLDMGVNPEQLHRVVAISSGALDSLPHNGYVVTTIRGICNESHKDAYWAVGAMTVVVPLMGLSLAILLFSLF
ncbi:MAG: GntP family permease [Pseudohongiellaceae bacterium]